MKNPTPGPSPLRRDGSEKLLTFGVGLLRWPADIDPETVRFRDAAADDRLTLQHLLALRLRDLQRSQKTTT